MNNKMCLLLYYMVLECTEEPTVSIYDIKNEKNEYKDTHKTYF